MTASVNIRVSENARKYFNEIAKERNIPVSNAIDNIIEKLRRQEMLEEMLKNYNGVDANYDGEIEEWDSF